MAGDIDECKILEAITQQRLVLRRATLKRPIDYAASKAALATIDQLSKQAPHRCGAVGPVARLVGQRMDVLEQEACSDTDRVYPLLNALDRAYAQAINRKDAATRFAPH